MKIPKLSINAFNAKKDAELINANNARPAESHRDSLIARQETERDDCEDIVPAPQAAEIHVAPERDSSQFNHRNRV